MGCWYSRLDREAMISRCKARRKYMKQLVKARQAFASTHSLYLKSLRSTGSALLSFASAEAAAHAPPASSPPPLPSSSPNSETTVPTATSSSAVGPEPSPPPPPPPQTSSAWDFWDPFSSNSIRPVEEDAWNETTTVPDVATAKEAVPDVAAPAEAVPDVAAAVPADAVEAAETVTVAATMVEIIQELDEYFVKAADAGSALSVLLDVPICDPNRQKSSGLLLWTWSPGSVKWNAFGKFCEDPSQTEPNCLVAGGNATHCSTVEKLYTWEKKLYQEVKNAENLKLEHEKKAAILKNLEVKGADFTKIEKAKKEVEKLESQVVIALQTIEATSSEIVRLRESELYPQLLRLVIALMNMWKSMHECHQMQTHAVQKLKDLNCSPSSESTSETHRQSTLQLELEAQHWQQSFSNLIKSQRDYTQSLTGWLRLSLFQIGNNPVHKTKQDDAIYSLCEEWQRVINNAPDNAASDGFKSFVSSIHAIVVQQGEEYKQKRRAESVTKELEKKSNDLKSLENKHSDLLLQDKRAKVEALRAKAEEEKAKYEKTINSTRSMSINSLKTGLPDIFQAMTGFAGTCVQAFESLHDQAKSADDLKPILP